MLPGFFRRLLRNHEAARAHDEPPRPEGETSAYVSELAAGDAEALGKIFALYHEVMIKAATRLTRRYRARGVFIEAEDALSGTFVRLLADARDGRISSMRHATEFWKEFLDLLHEELLAVDRKDHALKRGGPGSAPAVFTATGTIDELPSLLRRLGLDALTNMADDAPGPDDLALAKLEIEALLDHLNSPLMTEVVRMRLDQYSIKQISERVGMAIRTVERNLSAVREAYLECACV